MCINFLNDTFINPFKKTINDTLARCDVRMVLGMGRTACMYFWLIRGHFSVYMPVIFFKLKHKAEHVA